MTVFRKCENEMEIRFRNLATKNSAAMLSVLNEHTSGNPKRYVTSPFKLKCSQQNDQKEFNCMGNQKEYSISVCYSCRIFRNGPVNVRLAHQMKNVLLFQATRPTYIYCVKGK